MHPLYTLPSGLPARGKVMSLQSKPANAVQPPRIDRMHGPRLNEPAFVPARPGADDHKRHASRGLRC